jgi:hypothetical protein
MFLFLISNHHLNHFHLARAIIAQNPPFFLSDWPDESVIAIFDCAQGGAICSNECAIILSDTWGFFAGKQMLVDTVAHGNKLQETADAA